MHVTKYYIVWLFGQCLLAPVVAGAAQLSSQDRPVTLLAAALLCLQTSSHITGEQKLRPEENELHI